VIFCPFAAGYFLSFFFRNVNAVIARDLAGEFSLSGADLGFLTSMYLLAFAAFQLPLGVLLDRYGPRRVVAGLLCIAAVGALVFGLARDFTMLSVGRALIGLGVSGGLMGAIKAFTLWFPLSRLALLNGLYLAAGGIGSLSATAPAEAFIGPFGWRALFYLLAGLSLIAASLVFFVVPEKPLPGQGQTLRTQIAAFRLIFASREFWRIALAMVICHAVYLSLQGLWLAPWLADVAGLSRTSAANYLFLTVLAYIAGSAFFGMLGERFPTMLVFRLGLAISVVMFALIAAGVHTGLGAILAIYAFCNIAASLGYPLMTRLFPTEMTGRVNTASNLLMFALAFCFQWGTGAVLGLFALAGGRYAPEGYSVAFGLLIVVQLATLAWLFRSAGSSRRGRRSPRTT
jgi:predicted MFS family arabinose efflux permease